MAQQTNLLSNQSMAEICDALNKCVADTVMTTWQAQQYHWNVTGMSFGALHDLMQTIYEDHFIAQDDLAERIKALNGHAGDKLENIISMSSITHDAGKGSAEDMVAALAESQRKTARTLSFAAETAAQHGDMLTEDLCIQRGQQHEKFAWLLSAHLN